jgi:hypothetical protein
MRFTLPPIRAVLAALVLLPLAACDETGGFSDDVNFAVDDAVIARESGDYDTAVNILKDAMQRAPENAEVRVELATTILERDGIDLLDVDRIGLFITESAGAAGAAAAPAARASCPYAADPSATRFRLQDLEGYEEIAAKIGSLDEAEAALSAVMPASIQGFSICSSVVDGALAYDQAGAIAALRGRGLSETQVAQALAVNALVQLTSAYVAMTEMVEQETAWYRLADGRIVVCVDDPEALKAQAEEPIRAFGQAVLSLDARASILGSTSTAAELVSLALDAFEEVRDAVADYCSDNA